jgi:hypothetical protein
MKTIFDLATPRKQVLYGELREDIFAARLKDVMDGDADPVYQDPDLFFENTYPTAGLQTLLREVLGRLTSHSPTNNPIIRLETSFGGGKTHNLIALYHVAKGKCASQHLGAFVGDESILPRPGDVDVVGVVGSDLDPSIGIHHSEEGLTTYTLWGELAYQLGGRSGYALAQESDRNKVAPGTSLFERIVGARPTLIMIDEIARHLRAAVAAPTATGKSNLAEQTVAFLMSLLEFAVSQERVVVVLTMASDVDAFRQETESLAEALKVSARQERVLTPTGENEISAIVVHRLFKSVDREQAQETITRYGAYYRDLEAQGAHVHDRALRADYLNEFALAYPFHPELIRVLNLRVATIPNFQRTRGALRLLAAVVRQLWETRASQAWLIHPHHIDLASQSIIEDLTSRLDRPKFKQVCEADIVSPQMGIPAHATEADELLVASGKPSYARHVGTTIFLHSLTHGIVSGVELPELLLSVLAPADVGGDDPAVVQRALERLYEKAWFLEYDGYKYRFKTEPSLNKIVDDETGSVGTPRAKREIDERIGKIWKAGYLKTVRFPNMPANVDDDAGKPKLAIMHYDAVRVDASTTSPPDLVRRIYERAGAMESFRNYQNNVLFLVADADQVEQMVKVARRYLAIDRIIGTPERMREFNEEYQKKLRKMGEAAELEVRVAITRAYRFLFYPTGDARKSDAYLRREIVPPEDQGDTDVDQTNVVVRVLHNLQKVRTTDDSPLPAQYLYAKAWDRGQTDMSTEDLRRAFARKIGLPFLLDVSQLQRSIENGVKTRVWLYYDAREQFAYDHESPPAFWQIGEQTRLYTPAEAVRLNLRIKGKWQPPMPDEGGQGPGEEEEEPPDDVLIDVIGGARPNRARGTGVPAQAFQQMRDQYADHGAVAIRRLLIRFQGIEKGRANDLAAVGLAIPQMGKAEFGITLKLTVQWGQPVGGYLELEFQGDWDRYRQMRKVCEDFAREQGSQINAKFELVVDFDRDIALDNTAGQQLIDIQAVLTQMEMGPIEVEAELVYGEGSQ